MAGMEIAKLSARLGFDIDQRSLKNAERKIDQMANRMRGVTETYRKANGPAKSYAKNVDAIARRYDKVGGSLQRVRNDFYSVNEQFRQGNITAQRRNSLLEQMILEYRRLKAAKASAAATPDGTERRRGNHGLISALHSDTGLGLMAGGFAAYRSSQAYQNYQGIQSSLKAATGDAESAADSFQYLVNLSRQLGTNVSDTAKNFSQLAAAAKNTSLEGQGVRDIFTAVSSYSRVLNLNPGDLDRVFRGLTQTISKGQIYSEEARQQIGEQLPGFIQALARAGGYVNSKGEADVMKLNKAMQAGLVTAEKVYPKLSQELMKMANEGDALTEAMNNTSAAIGRFKTNVWLANVLFNQAGFDESIRNLFSTMSDATMRAEPLWKLLGQTSKFVGQAIEVPIELFGTLAERLGFFTDEAGKANEKAMLIGAALLAVSKKARTLFAVLWLIPATLSGINNIIQNGIQDWKDWAFVVAGIAASALLLRNRLGGIAGSLGKIKSAGGLGGISEGSSKKGRGRGGLAAGATGAMFLPQLTDIGNAGNSWLNENVPYFKETNDFMSEYNPIYRYFRETFGQNTGSGGTTNNNNLNGDITIEINGAQDSEGIKRDVLDTVNGLFRNAANSNPQIER